MYILLARYDDAPFIKVYQNKSDLLEGLNDFDPKIDIMNYSRTLEDGDIDFDDFPCNTAYLIKGNVVIPKVIQTITQFEVE